MIRGTWIRVALLLTLAATACSRPADGVDAGATGAPAGRWAIAIHGGAGVIPRDMADRHKTAYLESLGQALELGRSVLEQGGASLDAVERVITVLEDDPRFNAGRGAVFNHDGGHELDASIMDGESLACGAVAGVTNVRNPIALARLVMTETPHVLLGGSGAERFAAELGLEPVPPDYFDTEVRWEALQRALADDEGGTVGAVALDLHGNLAAGTSTGGLTNKRFGRIGDSPIIGAGTYADNRSCAISATGKGEEFIRHNVAARISILVEQEGRTLRESAASVVHGRLVPGDGGVIGVDREGAIAMVFNTVGMYRGAADSTGRFEVAIWE